jgi:beta-barrel assembly-enhancing protease
VIARRLLFALSMSLVVAASSPDDTAVNGLLSLDKDERGLWMQVNERERILKRSNFIITDDGLNNYVRGVFCKTVGENECKNVRMYLMRTPYFNASMAPNGMMEVWTGLLLRVRNEAQLAAVLGHEYTHYQKRHSLQGFKSAKKNLGAAAWLGGIVPGIQLALVGAIFSNSRAMESEADAASVEMLAKAGYDPKSAAHIWEQLRAEMDATAIERNQKSRKNKDGGMFATHPTTLDRVTDLNALAQKQPVNNTMATERAAYVKALAPFWSSIVDDQIKLNDFGATNFLLESLANEGWTPELNYARGELYRARGRPEDLAAAIGFYKQAVTQPFVPIEAWRGLGLALLRTGKAAEGQSALKYYLAKRPDAADASMLSMLAGEQK